ncbi:MAG TPA: 50S ribosomal protein L25/general stress protein Ctc [Bacteroidia bacterium]|nr:50S ribosomal protein L25/general stress protein Ctc [Bacteroidia bacterium]
MKSFELSGTKRNGLTKQDTKQLRDAGMIPCVIYGGDENVHFSAPILSFRHLVYSPEVFTVKINVDGKTRNAIMQEIQFHPISDKILHIDFIEIHDDKKVVIDVPISINGTSEGQKQGGKLLSKVRKLKIKALPAHLPDSINIDVTPLGIGQSVRVGDLKFEGVEFLDSANNIIVGIRTTRNVVETPAEAAKSAAAPAAAKPAAKPAGK